MVFQVPPGDAPAFGAKGDFFWGQEGVCVWVGSECSVGTDCGWGLGVGGGAGQPPGELAQLGAVHRRPVSSGLLM